MRRSLNPPAVVKNSESSTQLSPNPYVMALVTATLAGLFSVIGGYFSANFQARQSVAQKQLEYRVEAYGAFLDKTDRSRAPSISQILSIGAMADHLATDAEIQSFEDRIAGLLKKHDAQDLYWQMNSDLKVLRLHGSGQVANTCDDILKALLLRDEEIDWADYPQEVTEFHNRWKMSQEKGVAYGWKEKISSEERLMIVTIAKLTQVLIQQLRLEIHTTTTA
jgi:hypothetical protein